MDHLHHAANSTWIYCTPLRVLLGSTAPSCEIYLDLLHPPANSTGIYCTALRILLGSTAPRCDFYLDLLHPPVNSNWIYSTALRILLSSTAPPPRVGQTHYKQRGPFGPPGRARRLPCTPRERGRCITSKAPCTPASGGRCITSKVARWGFPGGPRIGGLPVRAPKPQKTYPCVTGIYTRNRPATKIWLSQT